MRSEAVVEDSMRKSIIVLLVVMLLSGAVASAQNNDFIAVRIVDQVKDSVVSIDANVLTYGAVMETGGMERSRTQRLLTDRFTGFVYTENGYIITDSDQLEGATLLEIKLEDGSILEAEVAGYSKDYGVGVIKVTSDKPLKPVKLLLNPDDPYTDPYSEDKEIIPYYNGDPVVAIGYSGGFGGTVTFGIISGVRNFRNRNLILLPHIIQSDVAINSGNEGCPLFNDQGQVIGMHDQHAGGMQNTTFFTPTYIISRVADEIIAQYEKGVKPEDQEIWRPWLGIKPFAGSVSTIQRNYRQVGDDLKMYLDMPDQYWDTGVLLDGIWQQSPGREYGLLDKDWLMGLTVLDKDENVKYPYELLKGIEELEIKVDMAKKGDVFVFQVLRLPNLFDLQVEVGQHPGKFDYGSWGQMSYERTWEYF
jgi:S1-C subfamily serine protease